MRQEQCLADAVWGQGRCLVLQPPAALAQVPPALAPQLAWMLWSCLGAGGGQAMQLPNPGQFDVCHAA